MRPKDSSGVRWGAVGVVSLPNAWPPTRPQGITVMGEARERSVADLGYSNAKVSRKVMEAYAVLNIIRTKRWSKSGLN